MNGGIAGFSVGSGVRLPTRILLEVLVHLEEVAVGFLGGMIKGQLQRHLLTQQTIRSNTKNHEIKGSKTQTVMISNEM